jgi:hypothetical protein
MTYGTKGTFDTKLQIGQRQVSEYQKSVCPLGWAMVLTLTPATGSGQSQKFVDNRNETGFTSVIPHEQNAVLVKTGYS